MRKDANLSNKDSDPSRATVECSMTVHYDPYQGKFPKQKLIDWLTGLPADAKIRFVGANSGKNYFEATWKEER